MRRVMLAVVAVLAASLPAVAPAEEALPDGCEAVAGGFACSWTFDTSEPRRSGLPGLPRIWEFPVPVLERALVQVIVTAEKYPTNFYLSVQRGEPDAEARVGVLTRTFVAGKTGIEERESDASYHYLETDPADAHALVFIPHADPAGACNYAVFVPSPFSNLCSVESGPASYTIHYRVEPVPAGAIPEHPAATRDDPHLVSTADDARRGAFDLVAAWFDDRVVGDGLFEAHLALRNASDIDPVGEAVWRVLFTVGDTRFTVYWAAHDTTPDWRPDRCLLFVTLGDVTEWRTQTSCDLDPATSTLVAVIPEGSVTFQSGEGAFQDMGANVHVHAADDSAQEIAEDEARHRAGSSDEDQISGERYPFAFGGPVVWQELNPRLRTVKPPWYRDPLAPANLADTLQVAGAATGAGMFLLGLVVVRRRRRAVRDLLDEIDRIADRHRGEPDGGLAALGALSSRCSDLVRAGRLTEGQYQVVAQRATFVATQFALRPGAEAARPGRTL